MKTLRRTIRKILQEHMIEKRYIRDQIYEINKHAPRIAKMLCSGDKEQIYQAKKEGYRYFTVIVSPHQERNPWKWTIEIITNAYAGENEVIKHFQDAIEASEHAYQRGKAEAVGKPKTIEVYMGDDHTYQEYTLEFVVTAPKELRYRR